MSLKSFVGKSFQLKAPAKINLRLKIEGRRTDGYHLLSMLNTTIALCDEIFLEIRASGISIEVVGSGEFEEKSQSVPPDISSLDSNIATKAGKLFFDKFEIPLGAHVRLNKRIPMGTGLGGGSSDAAAVLNALATTFLSYIIEHKKISNEEFEAKIQALSLLLGADVPYLMRAGLAWVSGIGERIEILNSLAFDGLDCLLIVPNIRVATKKAFELYRTKFRTLPVNNDLKMHGFIEMSTQGAPKHLLRNALISLIENDLETVVVEGYPEVGEALLAAKKITGAVCGMSGSGSAIFVIPVEHDTLPISIEGKLFEQLDPNKFRILRTSINSHTNPI